MTRADLSSQGSAACLGSRPARARAATAALFLANGIGIGAWAGLLPALQQRMGLSDPALSLALVGFAAGAVASMLAAPRLAGRFGVGRASLAGAFLFALALILPPLAPSLPVLVGGAVLLGATNGLLDVCMNANATAVERAWGTPLMSSFHALFSLGGIAGASGTGLILRAGYGPEGGMEAAAGSVMALLMASWWAGPRRDLREPEAVGEVPSSGCWPGRAVVSIATLAFLAMLVEGAVADWSGVFLTEVTGVSAAVAATAYASFAIAMVVGRVVGDRAVRTLGAVRVLGLGAGTVGSAVSVVLIYPGPVVARFCFAACGLGLSNLVPVLFSAAARVSPNRPEAGVAAAAMGGYAGFLAGPALVGLAAGAVGLRAALLILVGCAGTLAAAAPRLVRRPSG